MNLVVSLIGIALGLLAAVGIFAPFRVAAWLGGWPASRRYYVAILQRAVIGSLFLWAAPSCRTPRIIFWLGVLTLAAAAIVLAIGPRRLDTLVTWWLEIPAPLMVASYSAVAVFGCFLVYAGW